jgi:hypothetical protein
MSLNRKTYVWRKKEGEIVGGSEPADILVQHYNDEGFRTILLDEEDFKRLVPWKLCALLTDAYESGYKDAKADIRNVLEIK